MPVITLASVASINAVSAARQVAQTGPIAAPADQLIRHLLEFYLFGQKT